VDVYRCCVVGWMVAPRESGVLAERLIETSCTRQWMHAGLLTVHADRDAAMTSKPVAHLLADLFVTTTHSRPQVSNDSPYSEAPCKTRTCRPDFSARCGSLEDARAHAAPFFPQCNTEHLHGGEGLTRRMTSVTTSRPSGKRTAPRSRRPRTPPIRALCPPHAHATGAPHRREDQSPQTPGRVPRATGRRSANSVPCCRKIVDRLLRVPETLTTSFPETLATWS